MNQQRRPISCVAYIYSNGGSRGNMFFMVVDQQCMTESCMIIDDSS